MDLNFHYYVTYSAACQAGFSPDDALLIAQAARYVDEYDGVTVQSTSSIFLTTSGIPLTPAARSGRRRPSFGRRSTFSPGTTRPSAGICRMGAIRPSWRRC